MVATPIGNLGDISPRAVEVLSSADVIYCEDTRHSRPLCEHFGIKTLLKSYHEHNEAERVSEILLLLKAGKSIALISDAGTPLISDPGFQLVRAAQVGNFEVIAIPGACAAVAALSVAGLPTDSFLFAGFLPAKSKAKKDHLVDLFAQACTVICYESTHRIIDTLECCQLVNPERELVLAKELTKSHEAVVRGTAQQILAWLHADEKRTQGEFVLLIAADPNANQHSDEVTLSVDQLLHALRPLLPSKQVASVVCALTGHSKNTLYQRLLNTK